MNATRRVTCIDRRLDAWAGTGLALLLTLPGVSAEHLSAADVAALVERCAAARETRIAPLREEAISACVERGDRDDAGCRRFYRDYGEATRTERGVTIPRRFHDLPECTVSDAAEKHLRLQPP